LPVRSDDSFVWRVDHARVVSATNGERRESSDDRNAGFERMRRDDIANWLLEAADITAVARVGEAVEPVRDLRADRADRSGIIRAAVEEHLKTALWGTRPAFGDGHGHRWRTHAPPPACGFGAFSLRMSGGGRGIRTHGDAERLTGFQDRGVH
jgi:hypothetical protein